MTLSRYLPDLVSLDVVRTLARTGGVGATARELGLSSQAVTARVRSVEKLVGVRVLERDRSGTRLTDDGALLAGWAGRVLHAARELDAAIGALRGTGDLAVAAGYTVAEYLLPGWLVELHRELGDDAGVALAVRSSGQVARAVLDKEADVGFVEGPELPDGLRAATVSGDRLVLVVPPDHAWAARGATVTAADLASTALVTREHGSGTRQVLDRALAAAAPDVERPEPVAELSATPAIRRSVQAGDGAAVMSEHAVAEELAAGRLVAVPVEGVDLSRELRAVWREDTTPQGPARALLRIATGGRIR